MCRWLAYSGPPVHPDAYLFEAENSLIQQSMSAQLAITPTNGDGFGLGWYGDNPQPGLFRDVLPAWNDENLKCVAEQVESRLFFAHVRASTGAGIARSNCHPFRYGNWLFMHNGQIGGYASIRHELDRLIAPEFYRFRQGGTDSETFFYILLSNGLETDPQTAFARTVGQVENIMSEAGVESALRLTATATDGERIFAVRYANDDRAPTLYAGRDQTEGSSLMILSEPLNSQAEDWREVPMSHFITAHNGEIEDTAFAPQAT
jgi:glutamine amidotransferase